MNAIYVLFFFVVALVVNYLLRKLLDGYRRNSRLIGKIHQYFPVAEITFWAFFFTLAINIIFTGTNLRMYINYLIITVIFILIYWYFLRDYVAGIQLKSRFSLSQGKQLSTDKMHGTISRMGLLYMVIKSEDNSERKIPYSQVDQRSIIVNFQEKDSGSNTFTVSISTTMSDEEAIDRISELIINAPWSSYKSPPSVLIRAQEKGWKSFEISCKTLGENASKYLKERIEKELSST